jgi:hypothetical protein
MKNNRTVADFAAVSRPARLAPVAASAMTGAQVEARGGTIVSPASGSRIVHPQFTGSAREYFRIWIVNLFFTLVTLGVYSAWAKVRKKRYLYGNTRLESRPCTRWASNNRA